jgi:hypothetical protein
MTDIRQELLALQAQVVDYETALARIDVLMDAEMGTTEGEELDVLVHKAHIIVK